VDFLLQPPNTGWPTTNVPPCMTFTATPTTVIAPGAAQLTWSSGTGPYQAASCLLSASDGSFTTSTPFSGASGSAPTGTLNKVGPYTAQLMCSTASSTITGFAQTTVNVIQLAAISVTPAAPPPQVAAGSTVQLTATGTYSDGSQQPVTGSVIWSSMDSTVATVTPSGIVTCVSIAPTATPVLISAKGATATGTVSVTCLAPTLISVVVATPQTPTAAGATVQLTATANYSYGSPRDVTASATWTTSNATVATVSAGLVTCVAGTASTATITASLSSGGSGSTTVNCQAPLLQSIVVTPPNPTLAAGATVQLTATANYSYGSSQIVTGSATWSTNNAGVATVSGGLVTCIAGANGTATITASLSGGGSGSTSVICQAPVLKSISVTPTSVGEIGEIPNGGTQQMTATGTYSSGPPRNITNLVTWSSSSTYVATVSATGLLSCRRRYTYADGNTTVSATSGATTGSSNISCEGLGR
jgi:hypothetical protein